MRELGLDPDTVVEWFHEIDNVRYRLVAIPEEHAGDLPDSLSDAIRRCYVSDDQVERQISNEEINPTDVVTAVLPEHGPVMAGDFGEILAFLHQVIWSLPEEAVGPLKWRLKEDRKRAAPHSDLVHFIVPSWPDASGEDVLLCAEVKTKSTPGGWSPISSAIEDSEKDQTSRLARTLVWLRERLLTGGDIGQVTLDHLERFIHTDQHPPASKRFFAIAVICETLLEDEREDIPNDPPEHCTLVLISVPNLQTIYENAFESVPTSVDPTDARDDLRRLTE